MMEAEEFSETSAFIPTYIRLIVRQNVRDFIRS